MDLEQAKKVRLCFNIKTKEVEQNYQTDNAYRLWQIQSTARKATDSIEDSGAQVFLCIVQ